MTAQQIPRGGVLSALAAPRTTYYMVAALGASAIASIFLPSDAAKTLTVAAMVLGFLVSGILFIRKSQQLIPQERRAWRRVGLGMLIGGVGISVYVLVWALVGDVGAFSPVDLIWLTGYGVTIVGLSTLPHTAGSKWHRARLLLDGAIGAVASGALLWTLTIRSLTRDLTNAPLWDRFVGTSYVALDAAIMVALVMVLIKRSTFRFDHRLVLFGVGGLAQAMADYFFLSSGLGRSFSDAEPVYWLNILAVTMFLATASSVSRAPHEREYADRTTSPAWALIVPYGLALAMVGLLMFRFSQLRSSLGERDLLYAVALVALLTIARQAVAIQEGRRSLQEQRAILASSISHELKTPLTSIVGFLELLDSGAIPDADEQQDLIAVVNSQAGYLARVVSDLMLLAADSDSPMELDVEPIRVDELAWRAVNSGEIDPSVVRVDADRSAIAFVDNGRLQHALSCLLGNAVRYGGSNIELVARTDQSTLILEAHDDGPGVPRKYELVIWERFERGPHHLNATVPGSGIGLAITRKIAAAHGGQAGYRRSERLGGACFWIRLPARAQNRTEPDERPVATHPTRDARSA